MRKKLSVKLEIKEKDSVGMEERLNYIGFTGQ